MFPISRLVVFAFAIFFFGSGLAGAYVRCLDAPPVSEETSVAVKAGRESPNSGGGVLHCPEHWNTYRLVQSHHSLKKDPWTERVNGHESEALIWVFADSPSLANYALSRFRSPLLSTLWYPSIAIYQSKVVYRI